LLLPVFRALRLLLRGALLFNLINGGEGIFSLGYGNTFKLSLLTLAVRSLIKPPLREFYTLLTAIYYFIYSRVHAALIIRTFTFQPFFSLRDGNIEVTFSTTPNCIINLNSWYIVTIYY
jgi:hypothetical protein